MKSIAYNISLFFTCRRTNEDLFVRRQPAQRCSEMQKHVHEQVYGWILLMWLYKLCR